MTIRSLFKKRESLYYKNLLKYFRYIFNDHFSLVLFFLIGAGGYAYSNYLEGVTTGSVQALIILVFVYFFLSLTGDVTTLVEEPDQLFLLAKEEEFYPILKTAVTKSYVQSLFPVLLITFITFPIFVQTQDATILEGFLIFFGLASLKWMHLLVKVHPYFIQRNDEDQKYKLLMYVGILTAIVVMNFITILGAAIFTFIMAIISAWLFFTGKIYFNHSLKWDMMIEMEEARLHKIYRFIQIFMDVPHMETTIRRLSFLDKLLDWLTARYLKAPYYYLLRTATRNTEYSLLILRLIAIGALMILLTDSYVFSVIILLVFIYILGFQLISLAKDIERVPQFQLYPITDQVKKDSSYHLINQVLRGMTIFFTLSASVSLGIIGLMGLPIGWVASYIFSYYYVPTRLQE